ncbi:MAG: DsbA family protein [Parvularculaceae bacterium]|nr:DsbA family protein [Parvularculaceae bacterium]
MKALARSAVLAAALAIAACGGANSEPGSKAAADKPKAAQAAAKPVGLAGVKANDIVLGKADAPVTVIEFASPTCPHCAVFHETVFPEIKTRFIETGQVKYVFREFPTPPAEFAYIGGVLARCAGEKSGPDGYMAVLTSLFRNQHPQDQTKSWIFGSDPKGELLKIAAQAGMDATQFETCLKRQDLVELINANVKEGDEKYKITGTPSFVINGKLTRLGSIDDFQKAVDAARGVKPAAAPAAAEKPKTP